MPPNAYRHPRYLHSGFDQQTFCDGIADAAASLTVAAVPHQYASSSEDYWAERVEGAPSRTESDLYWQWDTPTLVEVGDEYWAERSEDFPRESDSYWYCPPSGTDNEKLVAPSVTASVPQHPSLADDYWAESAEGPSSRTESDLYWAESIEPVQEIDSRAYFAERTEDSPTEADSYWCM